MSDKAHIRQMLETLPYVSETWLEWSDGKDSVLLKTLVVEVIVDTDPNSSGYNSSAMEEIPSIIADHSTTMMISHLKIIPKRAR